MRIAPILIPMIKPAVVIGAGAGLIYCIRQIDDPAIGMGIGAPFALAAGIGIGRVITGMTREYREHYIPQREQGQNQERNRE